MDEFLEGTGSSMLNKSIIPVELQDVHEEITNLRNGKYPHHGEHNNV